MKLLIVRHGETKDNLAGVIQGQGPGELTELGRRQAQLLGQYLKDEPIDAVFCSDLARARETLIEILNFHSLSPQFTADLREKNFGDLEGRPWHEYLEVWQASCLSRIEFRPPRGENFIDVRERIDRFLALIRKKYQGQTVLICSHGGTIRILLAALLNHDPQDLFLEEISNASISTVSLNDKQEVENSELNFTAHLNEL
jgi:alpha-ribazole phosphatase